MYFLGRISNQQHKLLSAQAKQRGTKVQSFAGAIIAAYLSGRLVYKTDLDKKDENN